MSDRDQRPSLENVEARLQAVRDERAEKAAEEANRASRRSGMSLGMRIGIELIVAVLVGVGIGLFLDNRFDTSPIFTLALVSLGFAAGVMNVMRVSRGLDEAVGLGRAVREKDAKDAKAQSPAPNAWDDDDD